MKKKERCTYFGWYIVSSASVIVLLTMGMRLGIGPYVKPMMLDNSRS